MMIKVEICECIQPFNKRFTKGQLYILHSSKGNGQLCAYSSQTEGYRITPPRFRMYMLQPLYELYFKPLASIHVQNHTQANLLKRESVETILQRITHPFPLEKEKKSDVYV